MLELAVRPFCSWARWTFCPSAPPAQARAALARGKLLGKAWQVRGLGGEDMDGWLMLVDAG